MANRRPPQGRRMDFSRNDRGKSFRPGVSPWQGGTPGSDIPNLLPLAGGSTEATLALASNIINLLQPRQNPVPSLLDMPIRRDFGPSMGRYDRGYGPNRMGNQSNFRRSGNYNRAGERINSNRKPFRPHDGQRQQNKSSPKKEADSKSKSKESEQDKKDSDSTEKSDNKQDDKKEPQKTRYDDINPQLLKCHICNKSMWDGRSFENHLSGRAHAIMMQKTAESYALTADTMRQEFKIREMKRTRKTGQQQVRDFYCAMCDMYAADGSAHRTTVGHRKLKKYLHPTCTSCHKEMPTRIELDEHRLTPEHLGMMQDKQEVVGKPKPEVMVISTLHTEQLYLRDDRQRFKRQGDDKEREKREKDGDKDKEGEEKEADGSEEPKEGETEKVQVDKEDTIIDFKEDDDLTNISSDRFPEYSTERGVGRSFLRDFSCVQCALCRKLLDTRETAELHLRTWRHHQLFVRALHERGGKQFEEDTASVIDERVMLLVLELSKTLIKNGYVHVECSTDEESESDERECMDNSELQSGKLNDMNDNHLIEHAKNYTTEAKESVEGVHSDSSCDSYMSLLRSLSEMCPNKKHIKQSNNVVENVKNTVEIESAVCETNSKKSDHELNNNELKDDLNKCMNENTIEKYVNMDVNENIVNNVTHSDVTNDLIDKNRKENMSDDIFSQDSNPNSIDENIANEFENEQLRLKHFSSMSEENSSNSEIMSNDSTLHIGSKELQQISVYENVLEQITSLKDLVANIKKIPSENDLKNISNIDNNDVGENVNSDCDRNNVFSTDSEKSNNENRNLGIDNASFNIDNCNNEVNQTNNTCNTIEGAKRDENANVVPSSSTNNYLGDILNSKDVLNYENNEQINCIVPNVIIKQEPIEEDYKDNVQPTLVDTNKNISHNNNNALLVIKKEPLDDYESTSDRNKSTNGYNKQQNNMLMVVKKEEPLDVKDVIKTESSLSVVVKKKRVRSRNKQRNQQTTKNINVKVEKVQVNNNVTPARHEQYVVSNSTVARNQVIPRNNTESGSKYINWAKQKINNRKNTNNRYNAYARNMNDWWNYSYDSTYNTSFGCNPWMNNSYGQSGWMNNQYYSQYSNMNEYNTHYNNYRNYWMDFYGNTQYYNFMNRQNNVGANFGCNPWYGGQQNIFSRPMKRKRNNSYRTAAESTKRPHNSEESGNWKRRKTSPELDEDDHAENGHEAKEEEPTPAVKQEEQVKQEEPKKDGEAELPAADELEDWEQSVDEILREVKEEAPEPEQQPEQAQPKVEPKTPEKKQDEQTNTQENKEQSSDGAENKNTNNVRNTPRSSPRGRGRGRPRRF